LISLENNKLDLILDDFSFDKEIKIAIIGLVVADFSSFAPSS